MLLVVGALRIRLADLPRGADVDLLGARVDLANALFRIAGAPGEARQAGVRIVLVASHDASVRGHVTRVTVVREAVVVAVARDRHAVASAAIQANASSGD